MLALFDILGILFLFALSLFLVILLHELGHALMVLAKQACLKTGH
jgi:hypothetical protein